MSNDETGERSEASQNAVEPSILHSPLALEPGSDLAADCAPPAAAHGAEEGARAERAAQAVDEAFVLANDGVIRWLGDPVARIAAGDAPLAPRAMLVGDQGNGPELSAAIQSRVDLWLGAYVRRLLGPLFHLQTLEALTPASSEIASQLVAAFGVLERANVRSQVKGLDQTARAALRGAGVRFGAFYVFMPALMKPAHRSLATQLWAVTDKGAELGDGKEALAALAMAGRTSIPVEEGFGRELCRVAGFRLCGERAVRIDIVERLADIIRAEIAEPSVPGTIPVGSPYRGGFVATGAMTSLTGCSGPQFASILQSLGFARVSAPRMEIAPTESASPPLLPASDGHVAAADGESAVDLPLDDDEAKVPEVAALALPIAAQNEMETAAEVPSVEKVEDRSAAPEATFELWRPAQRVRAEHRSAKASAGPMIEGPEVGVIAGTRRRRRGPASNASKAGELGESNARPPRVFPVRWRGDRAPNPSPSAKETKPSEIRARPGANPHRAFQPPNEAQNRKADLNSPFAKLLELRALLKQNAEERTGK